MVEKLDVAVVRQKLEDERASLQRRMGELDPANGRSQNRNLDRADLAQSYTLQERNALLADQEQEQLAQIEAALQKLDDGVYGQCDNCGQPIASGRLEVLPYANLCIRCQSEQSS